MRIHRLLMTVVRYEAVHHMAGWHRAVARAAEVQTALLAKLLEQTAASDFGRDFGLARVRTIQDLRKALPIAGYERVAPYVERVTQGRTEALFPRGTRIHMFAMTSGTTGAPKHIPVTDATLRLYREGWHVWGVHALADHLGAFGAKLMQLTSPMDEHPTPCGIPAGAMSGLTAKAQRRMIQRMYVLPPEAAYAADAATKYYVASRLGLAFPRLMPITANPSTLLGLAREMDRRKDELLRDVADGTLSPNLALDASHRTVLEARLRPMPERARQLDAAARAAGHLYPKDAWELPLIGTWKGGTLSLYLRQMPRYWGDAPIRDIGLLASEGRMSVPLQTSGSAGLLDIAGTFFEFVPEEAIGEADPRTLLAHEVEVGRRYFIILTTPGGLLRYNIGDLIKVVDHDGPTPVIEFLNKGQHVASMTGEKITEFQAVTAVNGAIAEIGLDVRSYCLCPTWETPPHYSLLVEQDELPVAHAAEFAAAVDASLRGLNMEYDAKRRSSRLSTVRVKTISPGAWTAYDAAAVTAGSGRVEQYKHKFLVNEVDFERRFTILASYGPPEG
jgi:hypothetical protein